MNQKLSLAVIFQSLLVVACSKACDKHLQKLERLTNIHTAGTLMDNAGGFLAGSLQQAYKQNAQQVFLWGNPGTGAALSVVSSMIAEEFIPDPDNERINTLQMATHCMNEAIKKLQDDSERHEKWLTKATWVEVEKIRSWYETEANVSVACTKMLECYYDLQKIMGFSAMSAETKCEKSSWKNPASERVSVAECRPEGFLNYWIPGKLTKMSERLKIVTDYVKHAIDMMPNTTVGFMNGKKILLTYQSIFTNLNNWQEHTKSWLGAMCSDAAADTQCTDKSYMRVTTDLIGMKAFVDKSKGFLDDMYVHVTERNREALRRDRLHFSTQHDTVCDYSTTVDKVCFRSDPRNPRQNQWFKHTVTCSRHQPCVKQAPGCRIEAAHGGTCSGCSYADDCRNPGFSSRRRILSKKNSLCMSKCGHTCEYHCGHQCGSPSPTCKYTEYYDPYFEQVRELKKAWEAMGVQSQAMSWHTFPFKRASSKYAAYTSPVGQSGVNAAFADGKISYETWASYFTDEHGSFSFSYVQKPGGFCLPTRNTGEGELCTSVSPFKDSPACALCDSYPGGGCETHGYQHFGDFATAQKYCNKEKHCVGMTKSLQASGIYKLKYLIEAVQDSGSYECYAKSDYRQPNLYDYVESSNPAGFCTPWGSQGELCQNGSPYVDSPACGKCETVSGFSCKRDGYQKLLNDVEARWYCSLEPACVGFTKYLPSPGWYKLKSSIGGTQASGSYRCFMKQPLRPIPHEYVESPNAAGFCTPYGAGGGELCQTGSPYVDSPACGKCESVSGHSCRTDGYQKLGNDQEAARYCSWEPACVGFTKELISPGWYKLKSSIQGTHPSGSWRCFIKQTSRRLSELHALPELEAPPVLV